MKNEDDIQFEKLLNWVEGRLSPEETARLTAELETAVGETQDKIAWLQTFQQLARKYVLVAPPDELDTKLYHIFNKGAGEKQAPRFFRRLLASLTFDSYQQLTAVGVRASAAGQLERQFMYSTDLADITVDTQWNAQGKSIQLNGQIFPIDDADETIYLIELQQNNTTVNMAPADELGKFAFSSLAPNTYDLILSSEQNEIAITGLELQF